jgi:hypothetical protein
MNISIDTRSAGICNPLFTSSSMTTGLFRPLCSLKELTAQAIGMSGIQLVVLFQLMIHTFP